LTVTGAGPVPVSTTAQLTPFTKKPKVSLKLVLTYSLYSSEAKTYWKNTVAPLGTKSNSSTVASAVVTPDRASRSVSPGAP